MGVYNGGKYIAEQIDSIANQTHENWRLIISDDGSSDNTRFFIDGHTKDWPSGRLELREGPQKGFCQNFLSMLCDPSIEADYYAFSDQDDVWLGSKLEVAIKRIKEEEHEQSDIPVLYCGRTAYVRDDLKVFAHSPLYVYPKTFRNALVQSIAGANTMMFNKAAKKLAERAGIQPAVTQDWWMYQLVTGAGGIVCYDPDPQILYRQHPDSLIGGNTSVFGKFERVKLVIQGQFKDWSDQNILALNGARHCLNRGAKEVLDLFISLRGSTIKRRFRMLEVCGLYRQTWRGTISLLLAALFKKI
jgi:glycosyltransferase involved in cell wall biosynthesis